MKPEPNKTDNKRYQPLATRMRPRTLAEFVGQSHLLAPGKTLRVAIEKGDLHSMILWGPPGTGKTTLAQLMAKNCEARFDILSATFSGVKDIRKAVDEAKIAQAENNQATILFIDEIHRFNKSQQDVFLPFIEDGTFILVGATTENPSFELNNALLSRTRVYVLKRLQNNELKALLQAALEDEQRGLGCYEIVFPTELQDILIAAADGDGRQALNMLEVLTDFATEENQKKVITKVTLTEVLQTNLRRFDKQGEAFYDQISALHKSIRGSAPDAALYWLTRMLDGGCDPLYIARRLIRMANEDIGLADPRAQTMTIEAINIYERLGSPEGELALAQAAVYLACAPKSNRVYEAFNAAKQDAKKYGSLEVPLHLRNAPTQLMKKLDYGRHYRYAHDEPEAYAAGEQYFPAEMTSAYYYSPSSRGLEIKISERLNYLKSLDQQSKNKGP